MMNYSLKSIFSKNYLINILITLLPLSFILGNLSININVILIIALSILFYKKDILSFKLNFVDKIVTIFFFYLFLIGTLTSLYNFYFNYLDDYTVLFKSWAYLRFLIFYIILRYLINSDFLNLKLFFISCSICAFLVVSDIIFQFIFGVNIIGLEKIYPRHVTSFFGEEAIAGSYLQRFSLFLIFFPLFFFDNKNLIIKILFILLIALTFFALLAAGNRMPMIFFLFSIFLLIFLQKNWKKNLIFFLLVCSVVFTIMYNLFPQIKVHYGGFFVKSQRIVTSVITGNVDPKNPGWLFHGHFKEFYAGYETWKLNKIFGAGVKSFKYNCPKTSVVNCGPHPHNYYLELMADLGIIGLILFISTYLIIITKKFLSISKNKGGFYYKNYENIIFALFFVEFFPIKTTGSFFTTGNATYIVLILAILVSLLFSKNNLFIEKSFSEYKL